MGVCGSKNHTQIFGSYAKHWLMGHGTIIQPLPIAVQGNGIHRRFNLKHPPPQHHLMSLGIDYLILLDNRRMILQNPARGFFINKKSKAIMCTIEIFKKWRFITFYLFSNLTHVSRPIKFIKVYYLLINLHFEQLVKFQDLTQFEIISSCKPA